uniref:placental protein 13-like isoform X1 n=1 Tax=Callithrix jacchus TaxID=9483 RepID=UPI0023DD2B41|nr:placental protein 13-like isoform X1 [Callithrix jacchus]
MEPGMKPEGRAERDHLNAATQRFTQKTGQNSEESPRREQCHHYHNDPQLEVNFYTGTNEDSDIAFQFRVNFGDCVIMNTREIGMWRCEEKCYNVPFEDGKSFELRICAHYDEYKVMVNGQHIYNFLHRIPPLFVNMVEVWGDISLTRVLVYN